MLEHLFVEYKDYLSIRDKLNFTEIYFNMTQIDFLIFFIRLSHVVINMWKSVWILYFIASMIFFCYCVESTCRSCIENKILENLFVGYQGLFLQNKVYFRE